MASTPRVVVMLSGAGSNLEALANFVHDDRAFVIDHVISDQPDAAGLVRAQQHGIAHTAVPRDAGQSRDEHETQVDSILQSLAPDVIVLAGYMRILGAPLVQRWRGKMLNVHPSLLPNYRGLHTYRRALADGVRWHGTSVHFVTETLDGGPVIAQARVAVEPGDTEATLRERTQRAEHALYPRVVAAVARGEVTLAGEDAVRWHTAPLHAPLAPEDLNHAAAGDKRHG